MRISRIKLAAAALLAVLALSSYLEAAEKTVGVILTGDIPYYKAVHKAFTAGLSKTDKIEVLTQMPAPNTMAWVNAARKLVVSGADIIVTYGAPVTAAVLKETSDVPVVFAGVYDPDALGLRKKNSTGIGTKVPVAGVMKNLKAIVDFSRLGVVYNDAENDSVYQADEVRRLEGQFSFKSVRFNIKKFGDAAKIADVDALFISTSCSAQQCVDDIIGAARRLKVPTASILGGGEDRGVILTMSALPEEQGAKAAEIVSRIAKGESPALIAVEFPKKVEMVINLKEAASIGATIPLDLLTSATRIIK